MSWGAIILALLQAFPQAMKLLTMLGESLKKTPAEKRRESLSKLDSAIDKSKIGDNRELTKWLGKQL